MKLVILAIFLGLLSFPAHSQMEKAVNQHMHCWISTNNIYQLTNRWGLLIHIRRTDFLKNPSFYSNLSQGVCVIGLNS